MESSNNDKLSFGKTADDEIPNTNANNTDGNDGFFFPALVSLALAYCVEYGCIF